MTELELKVKLDEFGNTVEIYLRRDTKGAWQLTCYGQRVNGIDVTDIIRAAVAAEQVLSR